MSGWDSPRQEVELAWEKVQWTAAACRPTVVSQTVRCFDPEAPAIIEDKYMMEGDASLPMVSTAVGATKVVVPKSIFDPTVMVHNPELGTHASEVKPAVAEPTETPGSGSADAKMGPDPLHDDLEPPSCATRTDAAVPATLDAYLEESDSEQDECGDLVAQSSPHKSAGMGP